MSFSVGDQVTFNSGFNEGIIGEIIEVDRCDLMPYRVRHYKPYKKRQLRLLTFWTSGKYMQLIKDENMEQRKLQFHELETGKQYRLLHGGERDHGYNYTLNSSGSLYNTCKNRNSSVPFNVKTRFIEVKPDITLKVPSCEYTIRIKHDHVEVGCQKLSKEDALKIATFLETNLDAYASDDIPF